MKPSADQSVLVEELTLLKLDDSLTVGAAFSIGVNLKCFTSDDVFVIRHFCPVVLESLFGIVSAVDVLDEMSPRGGDATPVVGTDTSLLS